MLQLLLIALFPPAALLIFIYFVDKYQHEPWIEILKAVAAGVISAFIALAAVLGTKILFPPSVLGAIGDSFVNAAIPEELAKLLMLWLVLMSNRHFDEYFDGIVYAVCVGLGFAGLENILYLFGEEDFVTLGVVRGIISVPAHFLFAVAMGYYYSLVHFKHDLTKQQKYFYALCVTVVPILLHGFFDSFLMVMSWSAYQMNYALAGACVIAFFLLCIYMVVFAFKKCKKLLQTDKRMFEMLAQHQFNEYWTVPVQAPLSPQSSQQWNPSPQSPQFPQSPQSPQSYPPQDESPIKQ